MKTTTIFGLALLAAFSLARPCSADITYSFSDYSALEGGYTLTGSITTDGTIGAITGRDITSWNFSITNGTNTYAASGNSVDFSSSGSGYLQATSTAITMAIPSSGNNIDLQFQEEQENDLSVTYERANNLFGETFDAYQAYNEPNGPNNYFFNNLHYSNNLSLGANNPWTIATASAAVPEPSSLVMAGLGLAGLAGYGWRRRRAGV
jgi:hypothetical protein